MGRGTVEIQPDICRDEQCRNFNSAIGGELSEWPGAWGGRRAASKRNCLYHRFHEPHKSRAVCAAPLAYPLPERECARRLGQEFCLSVRSVKPVVSTALFRTRSPIGTVDNSSRIRWRSRISTLASRAMECRAGNLLPTIANRAGELFSSFLILRLTGNPSGPRLAP